MGMFNWVNFETKCPVCGRTLENFQTKDAKNNLDCLKFYEVDNFYNDCECGTWVEFNLKKEVREKFTIDDYEIKFVTPEQRKEEMEKRLKQMEKNIEKLKEIEKRMGIKNKKLVLAPVLTPIMKEVLILLREAPRKDLDILDKIPNSSLEILGKLRGLEAIDHHGRLVYITSIGEKMLEEAR